MTWNYCIVQTKDELGEIYYEVAEVYYNKAKKPYGYGRAGIGGETIEELLEELKMITKDIHKRPYLVWPEDFVTMPARKLGKLKKTKSFAK